MIIKKIILTSLVLIIFGCNESQKKIKVDDLIGHWAPSENDDVSFTLKKNGVIEYFEKNTLYHYSINKNKLVITEEGQLLIDYEILLLSVDSLHLKTEEGIAKFVKRGS